jgi:hypothetical protein
LPDDLVTQDPEDNVRYEFNWDRRRLASSVTIDSSLVTFEAVKPTTATDLTLHDAEITADDRRVRVSVKDGQVGALYRVMNKVTTNESPAQTWRLSFFLKIERG